MRRTSLWIARPREMGERFLVVLERVWRGGARFGFVCCFPPRRDCIKTSRTMVSGVPLFKIFSMLAWLSPFAISVSFSTIREHRALSWACFKSDLNAVKLFLHVLRTFIFCRACLAMVFSFARSYKLNNSFQTTYRHDVVGGLLLIEKVALHLPILIDILFLKIREGLFNVSFGQFQVG